MDNCSIRSIILISHMLKMLEKSKIFLKQILDFILPPRAHYEIVRKLSEDSVISLPKSDKVLNSDWIIPLFQYKDNRVKAIIWELKYKENTKPLPTIGQLIFDEIVNIISDIIMFNKNAEFLLVPIPMTDKAKIERNYNQSELISKAILEHDTQRILIYAPQWLLKIKETPKQSHSESKEERMKNLENCFEANKNISGKYVFLIDDVVTTGSTLKEARKTLIEVGAEDVYAFTIAH